MTDVRLRLHGSLFDLRAPAAAIERLTLLFHPSVIEREPLAEPAAASFELRRVDGGWALLRGGRRTPLGTFPRSIYALLLLEHTIEELLLERLGDSLAFHAGAVVIDGGACLLAGAADRGKSSTTFQLTELGHAFLAEEIAAVAPDDRVSPYPRSLGLDPRVIDELARTHPLALGRCDTLDDLLARYTPHRVSLEPAPLASIVLPAFRPGEPPAIERLRVDAVLTELLGYCFEPRGGHEAAIDRVIELASGRPLLRMRYPDAAAARRLLVDHFGSASS